MGLEAAPVTIAALDNTWPTAIDPKNQGDDHLRNIKTVLKTIFPGAGGAGFATPLTLTEAQLNTAVYWPSGTKVPFYQAAPPAGWTAETGVTDSMLRFVTSGTTGGTSGGVDSPTIVAKVAAHSHTFTTDSDTHTHQFLQYSGSVTAGSGGTNAVSVGTVFATTLGDAHTHTGTTNNSTGTLRPKYMDFCVGIKT